MSVRIFARAVLVNRQGKFLVVKNLARNRYEFPGGKQDPGETSIECAFRELKEEIGVVAKRAKLCCTTSLVVETGEWQGDFWLVPSYKGKPRIMEPAKLGDLRWATVDEIAGLPQIPRVCVDVARKAQRLLRRSRNGA